MTETIAKKAVGSHVIVRSHNEGINIGTVVDADETGVILENVRRLWYHKPASKESWYEGVALDGLSESSKISATVPRKYIIENYSMTLCSDKAYEQIMAKESHKSS